MFVLLPSRALRSAQLAAACAVLALAPSLAPAQGVMNPVASCVKDEKRCDDRADDG